MHVLWGPNFQNQILYQLKLTNQEKVNMFHVQ